MKRFLLVVLSTTTLASYAGAADMAPYSPAMPAFSWSGVYGGANIGYGWGEFDGSAADISYIDDLGTPGDPTDDISFVYPGFNGSLDTDGVVGGLYGGANFEIGGIVFGLDADYSWSGISGDATTGDILINDVPAGRFGEGSLDVDWLAHVRGRLGYGFDRFMVFVAGGLAVAGLDSDASYLAPLGVDLTGSNGDESVTGWTIGGGIEWAATDNLIVRAEYLYDQFDDVNLGRYQVTDNNFAPPLVAGSSVDGDLSVNIFRVGVSWKFGSMF